MTSITVASPTLQVAVALTLLAVLHSAPPAQAETVTSVIKKRCVDCHSGKDPSGGVDLSVVLGPPKDHATTARLWVRIEKMIASRKMPPADAPKMQPAERRTVVQWYRDRYILRNGKPHIGVSPLRRLTRYELENTLEDVLSIRLKRPYVVSTEQTGLAPSTIEQIYPPDIRGESGFDNDADQLRKVRVPILKYIDCVDYALRIFDQNAAARKTVLGIANKPKQLSPAKAKRILDTFVDRAHRGYDNARERAAILRTWSEAAKTTTGYRALLKAMKTALLSPGFLYRMEVSKGSTDPYRVSAGELAVRLSYFLWATMPDRALSRAAEDGSLLREDVLKKQIARMLNSPRRVALSESFAAQWLGFGELRRNKVFYHGEAWTRGVYDELLFGFDEVIKADRSVLEIVDSDWAYLRRSAARAVRARPLRHNEKYADIFAKRRIRTGLKVERFYDPPRLYRTEKTQLGGMLTSAGVMRLTSAPNRTSPIRRGVWLLETIIGETMEPPENIPPLADSEKKLEGTPKAASLAAILKLHTSRASCRACHQHIDPLGLGLENFSPMGTWRTSYRNKSRISPDGALPNGKVFTSPRQMKRELLAFYKDRITENIVRRMLSYAIGRKLHPHDRVTIDGIKEQLKKNGYRMGVLIEQIVLSQQFRYRQDKL